MAKPIKGAKLIDTSKFPSVQARINELGIEDRLQQIIWTRFSKPSAAQLLAELSLMCNASISNNFELRNKTKKSFQFFKSHVGKSVHPFAITQAQNDLNITKDRLEKLVNLQMSSFSTSDLG
ncbi:MAG: hypothetical protein ACE3L7_32480 [Candidatus Pristimantibacillus sp.]